jgi:MoxR-like ATPase
MSEQTARRSAAGARRRDPVACVQEVVRRIGRRFLAKDEIARLVAISAVAGEHMVIVGPPGTAKSALIRTFSRLCDARYFEYLLTRFTEPNEIFGPVDMRAFRDGLYTRRVEGMLPQAEIVFLDEIFKANSAILNTLLTVLNERRFMNGAQVVDVPLLSVFAASNEVPADESLDAVFDRFLLRVYVDNLDSYHFQRLVGAGLALEREALDPDAEARGGLGPPLLTGGDLRLLSRKVATLLDPDPEFLAVYKGIIFQLRGEGMGVSDRRAIKMLKLCAASALLAGRDRITEADLFILKHIWNNLDQRDLVTEAVDPVLERYYAENPDERVVPGGASIEDLAGELRIIRQVLTGPERPSDVQLFAQLKNLQDLRVALLAHGGDTADALVEQIDRLLEAVFQAG